MASFSHAIEVAELPEAVFPWLLEQDRVQQWTADLAAYQVLGDGPLHTGSRIRQDLQIGARRFELDLEVTRYEPPRAAESRVSTQGIELVNRYALEPAGVGTRLTQSVEAKATSLKGRMLIPIVQPRLEQKLTEDLERLKALLDGAP